MTAMEQRWQRPLRGQGLDDILDHLTLKKVTVSKDSGAVRVQLASTALVAPARLDALRRRLATILGASRVELTVDYSVDTEAFFQNFAACREEILAAFCAAVPSLKPWMSHFQWQLEGREALVLQTEQQMALELFERKHCARWLAGYIQTAYGVKLQVRAEPVDHTAETVNERVELINRQQEVLSAAAEELRKAAAQPKEKPAAGSSAPKGEPDRRRFMKKKDDNTLYGYLIEGELTPIAAINERSGEVVVEGKVLSYEARDTKSGKKQIVKISVFDGTCAIMLKAFIPVETTAEHKGDMSPGAWIKARGVVTYDPYDRDLLIMVNDINKAQPHRRMDNAPEKRVELHAHTKMSLLDAVTPVKDLIKTAKAWGHGAIAITDHGVVQAFPEAFDMTEKDEDFKVILGMEGYLVDTPQAVTNLADPSWDQTFVVFDVETTGLHVHKGDRLTEIGAVKVVGGKIVDRFSTFVNPERPIPDAIQKLTGITDEMVASAPNAQTVLAQFRDFSAGAVFVAHNASFDMGFIIAEGKRLGCPFGTPPWLDTLALARLLYPELKSHKLNTLAKFLHAPLQQHHRAVSDAETTVHLLLRMVEEARSRGVADMSLIPEKLSDTVVGGKDYHIIFLVQNQTGLRNLYRMITRSHLEYFYRRPRIPRKLLEQHREGLLVGSACEAGDLFQAVFEGREEEDLLRVASFYDYLEVQPLGNNEFMLRNGSVSSREELQNFNRTIIALGEKLHKPVVATGDVHFLEPGDEVFRKILFFGQKYNDAEDQPPLYFRTTEEMLAEFSYLDPQKAREIVIEAPRRLAQSCEKLRPFPKETYHPSIPGAEDEVRSCVEKCKQWYGDPLPEIVQARLDKELKSIIGHGFSALYLTASRLVTKSVSDGYLVGSRGSVGSSFVATLMGITEVNPLPPHYRCPHCLFSDFDVDTATYQTGVDLPDRDCPRCGAPLRKEGYDIQFEVFLGFDGDKVPDIDLNFSGVYQPVAHKYTETLFGAGNVFRAGTISGLADKTAYGYVSGYLSDTGRTANRAEVDRLVAGITGVKRTTGQHPGGIVVVPKEIHVELFSPLQHPADDKESGIITTHFDFNSLHDRLVKLDILGHDDPTVIRMLQDLTGIEPRGIPLTDEKVISLFQSPAALGVTPEDLDGCPTGTLGIPEFGTEFVRQMLVETKPVSMADLLRISGLSHGTNVWNSNAQDLIADGVATLPECICTREDIMTRLIRYGLDYKLAFNTMEKVRKGKGLSDEMREAMREHDVPEWFLQSCEKISYLFPKAHAAAYVMMAVRIAWFKVYHPKAYYATYLTVRAGDAFDISLMGGGGSPCSSTSRTIRPGARNAPRRIWIS